jgi:aminoglycoside phosphotransferase (APT) family kinase protein
VSRAWQQGGRYLVPWVAAALACTGTAQVHRCVPPPTGGQWAPVLIVGHNDAAPYNAVWRDGRLAGFFDWDMAGPVAATWDVAFAAFSWVPLHGRHVVAREGFTDFEGRLRRLQLFLAEYGWTTSMPAFLEVVVARIQAHVASLRDLAARDPLFARIVAQGGADDLQTALAEIEHLAEAHGG